MRNTPEVLKICHLNVYLYLGTNNLRRKQRLSEVAWL